MAAIILNGVEIAREREPMIKEGVALVRSKRGKPPRLDVVMASQSAATLAYVGSKRKKGQELGIEVQIHDLGQNAAEREILDLVLRLNGDKDVDGFIVQLPLPKHVNATTVLDVIDPTKDVDGLSPFNVGKLWRSERPFYYPCTPMGVLDLLVASGLPLEGLNALIIGRSNIVGKPLAALLLQNNLTVTVAHSKTKNLKELASNADVLVAAIGVPNFVTSTMVKSGAAVIDVGINRVDGKLVGDVRFDEVVKKAGFITPVPGGVGPLTVSHLMENVVNAAKRNCEASG